MITAPTFSSRRMDDSGYVRTYTNRMRDWRDSVKEEAERTLAMSQEFDRVPEMIKMLEGTHWDRRRPRYLSSFYDNRIEHTRYSNLSLLTDIRPVIDVHSNVEAYKEQANIAQKIIHHEWYQQALDLSMVSVVDTAMLFGNGFWKITASKGGYMNFVACGPDVVMPVQPGFHIQDSTAVLYRTYKPLHYFQKLWPERCANLEEEATMPESSQSTLYQKPGHIPQYTWSALSPQMRYRLGLKSGRAQGPSPMAYPVIELQEYWVNDQSTNDSTEEVIVRDPYLPLDAHNYHYRVAPGGRMYPRKRLIVYAGNRLMYDGPSPYWHGLYPFSMLRLNPVMWSFWGLSKYRNLVPLNKAMNEVGAGTLDMLKRALNPQMITKEGGVPKEAWDRFFPNMPGGKLRLGTMSDPQRDVRYMDPPQLPGYVFQFLAQFLSPEYDRMSGVADTSSMLKKKQVPGGDAIEQMRDMMNPSIRLEGRYIEGFLRDSGNIGISNIFQFYDASKRLRILGGDGLTLEDFDYDPGSMVPDGEVKEDHHKMFSMEVSPGSLHGSSKIQEKTVAMTLFKLGAISRKELLRRMEIPNADMIEKELIQEHKDGIPVPGAGGRTPRQNRNQRQGEVV